jgi:hypothetical protein
MPHPVGRNRKKKAKAASPSYLQLVRDNTPPIAPAGAGASDARRRVVIVPLDDPNRPLAAAGVPRLAPPIVPNERRHSWPGHENGDPATRLVCPACGDTARVDVVDLREKRLHLSCDRCYRMWQDQVRSDDDVPAGLQRQR